MAAQDHIRWATPRGIVAALCLFGVFASYPAVAGFGEPPDARPGAPRRTAGSDSTLTFPDSWWHTFDRTAAFDSRITLLHEFSGELVAAGDFRRIGDIEAMHIARWSGEQWHALGAGLLVAPREMIETQSGLVAAVAGQVRRWNGTVWEALGPDSGSADQVLALAVYREDLFAAYFSSGLKRWDGSDWVVVGTVQGTYAPSVQALTVYDDKLIAAGRFALIGSTPASAIAAWDGNSWIPLGSGMSAGALVDELVSTNAELIASGSFSTAGGIPAPGLARWNGTSWQGMAGGAASQVQEWRGTVIAIRNDRVVTLVEDSWHELPTTGGRVTALGTVGVDLYSSKKMPDLAGEPQYDIERFDDPSWTRLTPGVGDGLDGVVRSMVVYHDTLVVAGGFSHAGNVASAGIAFWDGGRWHGFPKPNLLINAMLIFRGDLVVAGTFRDIDGRRFNSIARWDGSAWQPLGNGLTYVSQDGEEGPARVYSLAEFESDLIAGGYIGSVLPNRPPPRGGIARWDGAQWGGMAEGPVLDLRTTAVTGLAVHDGELVAVASHNCYGDARGFVSRWAGNAWTPMEGLGAQDAITLADELHTLNLVVECDPPVAYGLARWNRLFWEPHAPEVPALIRAARLSVVRGNVVRGTSLWNGTRWSVFGSGTNGTVHAAVDYRGGIYFGGEFTAAGGQRSLYLARWDGPPTSIQVQDLHGWADATGVHLNWKLASTHEWPRVRVLRASNESGPYRQQADLPTERVMRYSDPNAEAGNPYWYRIVLISALGHESLAATIRIDVPALATVRTTLHVVNSTHPGPVEIRYRIGSDVAEISLEIFDVRGRRVQSLARGPAVPGEHVRFWDKQSRGARAAHGVYVVRLTAGRTILARKFVVVDT